MKKSMLILCAVILMTSCSLDDDDQINVTYPLVPVESVVIPESMVAGTEYEIELTYTLPTTCHTFNQFIAEEQENLLYIGVQSIYDLDNAQCSETPETAQTSFTFTPIGAYDSYTFKFWQRENDQGEAVYLTKEVIILTETGGNE